MPSDDDDDDNDDAGRLDGDCPDAAAVAVVGAVAGALLAAADVAVDAPLPLLPLPRRLEPEPDAGALLAACVPEGSPPWPVPPVSCIAGPAGEVKPSCREIEVKGGVE